MTKRGRKDMAIKRHLTLALSLFACLGFLISGGQAEGAVVTLKIRAINPSKVEKKKVQIKSCLPQRVTPEDVVSSGDLDVSYDMAAKTYVVAKEVELGPAETRTFEVVIKDIWEIPEAELKGLSTQASKLSAALKGSDKAETVAGLQQMIDENLKSVTARQAAAAVGVVKTVDHIRVNEANRELLEQVRKDLGVMENLAIAAGKDLETLLGSPKIPPPRESASGGATGAVVTLHIKITNPSLTEKRTLPLRHEFPAEVRTTDVVDPAGLQIGFDAARNLSYAYTDGIELGPQESKVFDVKIRDPWAGLTARLPRIEQRCQDILAITKDLETYKAVDAQARDILKEADAVKSRKAPAAVGKEYVAFSRQQAESVHELETKVQRLEEIFQPHEKPIANGIPVMDVPRPDKRTTWILIYIILVFLASFSILFFVRWYGKGKDEKLQQAGPGTAAKPPDKAP